MPVPPLVGEAQGSPNVGPEAEPADQHVGCLAPGREVVDRPRLGAFLERPSDLLVLFRVAAGSRERHHRVEDLGRIRRVEHQRLGEEGDVVAEDCGDFVRVGRAPHVAEQRDPIGGIAYFALEAGFDHHLPKPAGPGELSRLLGLPRK